MTKEAKLARDLEQYGHWHKWFAWYPVKVTSDDKHNHYVWLGFVGRKGKLAEVATDMYGSCKIVGDWKYCDKSEIVFKRLQEK